jgi:hypothetical protein
MKNYTWAWKDDDDLYLNNAETLAEIVEEVVEYYLDEEGSTLITTLDETLQVKVVSDNLDLDIVVELNTHSVGKFLNEIANEFGREDHFEVIENDS